MKNKKLWLMLSLLCVYAVAVEVCPALAAYGDGKVDAALEKTTDWLTKVLGAAMVIIGIIIVGIRMAMHDERALQKGVWVVVGGLLIFLSTNILSLIKAVAGF